MTKKQNLRGYQEIEPWHPRIDLGTDFVMVYGNDPSLKERITIYKKHGYRVHLMTGITWGDYADFLNGEWDGRKHWDIAQRDANATPLLHGNGVPYVVPTLAFVDYLTDTLKNAVALGVEAIHLEEPEFWDEAFYSEAFKREFEVYYRKSWQSQESSLQAHYETAQLKAAKDVKTYLRIKLPKKTQAVFFKEEDVQSLVSDYDKRSATLLVHYQSTNQREHLRICF